MIKGLFGQNVFVPNEQVFSLETITRLDQDDVGFYFVCRLIENRTPYEAFSFCFCFTFDRNKKAGFCGNIDTITAAAEAFEQTYFYKAVAKKIKAGLLSAKNLGEGNGEMYGTLYEVVRAQIQKLHLAESEASGWHREEFDKSNRQMAAALAAWDEERKAEVFTPPSV
jgi:hypothetical protein